MEGSDEKIDGANMDDANMKPGAEGGKIDLADIGWDREIKEQFEALHRDDGIPGRIASRTGRQYHVLSETGDVPAVIAPSLLRSTEAKADLPAVGDWVAMERIEGLRESHIVSVLARRNKLSRMGAGERTEEQVMAANIDMVFIVTTVDHDFNLRRLERYLVMVNEMGARPVIVLNKIDTLDGSYDEFVEMVHMIAPDITVIPISAQQGSNIDRITELIEPGRTIVLVGSSGVGKSTLINRLLGFDRQAVGEIRESDSKGRHVTTTRELVVLPNGGMMIDNPGIRELQLWSSGDGVARTFEDIEELARHCRFKDCRHEQEPGCAVISAVKDGVLDESRLQSYRKLMRELENARLRRNVHEKRKADKKFGKMVRKVDEIKRSNRGW
jgi:ribosome biogenesis GTPase